MSIATQILQVIIGLGILNVWLLRSGKASPFRGGASTDLKGEFAAYGLPAWSFWAVGIVKVGAACALLLGLFVPAIVAPAAWVMVALMAGAVGMHLKVGDPPLRSLPAAGVLACSLIVALSA